MDWKEAEQKLKEIREAYEYCPIQSMWFVLGELKKLEERYNSGERSNILFEEIELMYKSL